MLVMMMRISYSLHLLCPHTWLFLLSWISLEPLVCTKLYSFRASVHCYFCLCIIFSANHERRSEEPGLFAIYPLICLQKYCLNGNQTFRASDALKRGHFQENYLSISKLHLILYIFTTSCYKITNILDIKHIQISQNSSNCFQHCKKFEL